MGRKTAYLGLFAAAAMLLGYVESLIPVFVTVPGMKLGLANLAVILALYLFGWKEAAAVSAVRILLSGFLFGNLVSMAFSAAGGALSLGVMILLKKTGRFSMVGVSAAGGVFHNIGQLLVAALTVSNFRLFYYLAVLLITGTVTGTLIGLVAGEIRKRLETARKGKGGA
jgi:heptaprenyl diphosphate synthase